MSIWFWVIMGVLLTVLTAVITLIWWWVGDQWADDEYKKFGHGGGARPMHERTSVITDEGSTRTVQTEARTDD